MRIPEAGELVLGAERETGFSDWHTAHTGTPFRALDVLVRDLNTTAQLHELGAQRAYRKLHELLCARLKYIADRKRFPNADAENINAPIILLGLPRSGTTFLHNLLGADPDNRVPRTYEMFLPAPKIETSFERNLRIQLCHEGMSYQGMMDDDWQACHPFGAARAEECIFIWDLSLLSVVFPAEFETPNYSEFVFSSDFRPLYREHRAFLQYLQQGDRPRRWVLKTPLHVRFLEEVFEVYPDALVLHCHRDPAKVYGSMAQTIAIGRKKFSDQPPPPDAVTSTYDDTWKSALSFRKRPGMAERFMDIHFLDLQADPIGMVQTIYQRFNIKLTSERRDVLKKWLDQDRAKHKTRARHPYSLDAFGLTLEAIDKANGDYVDVFNVKLER